MTLLGTGTRRRPAPGRTRHVLRVNRAVHFHGYLCLDYAVHPVPPGMASGQAVLEGAAGIAIADHGVVLREGHSAYRRSSDGTHVVGVLRIGPAPAEVEGTVRLLFAPLAHSPELAQVLCEVDLRVGDGEAEPVSIRWA